MSNVYDDALHLIEAQGGSFVKSLAACYYCADPENKQRLRVAFPEYFEEYERKFRLLTERERFSAYAKRVHLCIAPVANGYQHALEAWRQNGSPE
jgi:hypothetical protein